MLVAFDILVCQAFKIPHKFLEMLFPYIVFVALFTCLSNYACAALASFALISFYSLRQFYTRNIVNLNSIKMQPNCAECRRRHAQTTTLPKPATFECVAAKRLTASVALSFGGPPEVLRVYCFFSLSDRRSELTPRASAHRFWFARRTYRHLFNFVVSILHR